MRHVPAPRDGRSPPKESKVRVQSTWSLREIQLDTFADFITRRRSVWAKNEPSSQSTATDHRVLPSSFVAATPQFTTAVYGIAAVFAWGTSDFLGGYATRRANAFLFTTVVNLGGLVLVGTLASSTHAQFPSGRSVLWVLAGGACGGGALAIFYRALSTGRMGLTAPVAAVLSAAIPTVFGMFTEGLPGRIPMIGFFLAAVGFVADHAG